METQEKPTITIDDKSYIIEELSEGARYCIAQIQDLQQQSQAARARVDQLEMSNRGFMEALRKEIDAMENPTPEGE
jgi:FtsZ-binding cell division protein ZapB